MRARSTWRRASRVCARAPNISRMISCRSATVTPGQFLPVPLLGRGQFVVENDHVAFRSFTRSAISCALPLPIEKTRMALPVRDQHPVDDGMPSVSTSSSSSSSRLCAPAFSAESVYAPMSRARSTIFSRALISNIDATVQETPQECITGVESRPGWFH